MAEGKRDKTGGQTIGKAIGQGSGKPRKSRREEPDRREIRSGKERVRHEPYQGKAQRYQSIVDSLHHLSAQPGQIGRGGTPMAGFFSMGDAQNDNSE